LLYWNSREQKFIDLMDLAKSYPADSSAHTTLQSTYAGNMLGGANYPNIATGPNGDIVVVWQEWEDNGSGYPVMASGLLGTSTVEFPASDIVGAYSHDGGVTWTDPFWLAGTAGESDCYPYITPDFHYNTVGDSLVLDIAYMWDTNAGVSLFADTDASECIWFYEQVKVKLPLVGIEKEESAVNNFNLEQNYPNPFNPVTTIKFNVEKASNVTLVVFNVAGERVATLVNGNVNAGLNTVTFNGADYASGVYFYQLTAANQIQTRKMLLVK